MIEKNNQDLLTQGADKPTGHIVINFYESGSWHIDRVENQHFYTNNTNPPEAKEDSHFSELPEVLRTPEAMLLWQKAQQAGYIDNNYQPLISRTQAALLADEMAKRLGIREKWKVFETLWNRRNMYRDYQDALNQRQTLQFSDNLKNLFK
jgi:hypothetical protein